MPSIKKTELRDIFHNYVQTESRLSLPFSCSCDFRPIVKKSIIKRTIAPTAAVTAMTETELSVSITMPICTIK